MPTAVPLRRPTPAAARVHMGIADRPAGTVVRDPAGHPVRRLPWQPASGAGPTPTPNGTPGGHMGIWSGPGRGTGVASSRPGTSSTPVAPNPAAAPKATPVGSVSLNHTHLYNAAGRIIGTGGSGTYNVGKPVTIKGKSFYKITRSGKTYYVPATAKSAVFHSAAKSSPVGGGGAVNAGAPGGLSDPGGAIAGGSGAGYGSNAGSGDLLGRLAGVSWISAAEIVVLLIVGYYAWTKVIGPRVGRKLSGKHK